MSEGTLTSNFLASYIARCLTLSSGIEMEFDCPIVFRDMVAFCTDNNINAIFFLKILFVSVKVLMVAILDLRKTVLTSKQHGLLGNKNKV